MTPSEPCAHYSNSYFMQDFCLYDETVHALHESLREFYHYKSAIIHDGGRKGKRGIIEHFEIPKLEMLQIIPCSTKLMGAPYQWTSDVTERCHITHAQEKVNLLWLALAVFELLWRH